MTINSWATSDSGTKEGRLKSSKSIIWGTSLPTQSQHQVQAALQEGG